MKTDLFSIGAKDLIKSVVMAVLSAVAAGLYNSINNNALPENWQDWKTILLSGFGAGLAYLMKNFLTNSDGKFLKKEEN